MIITKIEAFRLNSELPMNNTPVGCRIYTDTGLVGCGEAGMAYGCGRDAAFAMINDLAQKVIGMDPLQTELIWNVMFKTTFWGQNGGPVIFSAISAIDIALWDIKGKYFGVPVYQLLGGKVRSKLRAYASQLQFGWGNIYEGRDFVWAVTPADYAANARLAVDEGYDAIKIDFFDRDEEGKPLNFLQQTGFITPKLLNMVEARMKAVRDEIGYDIDIIMENHSYPDAIGAVQLGKLGEKYKMLAFEEPNTPTVTSSQYITKYCNIPIANGERIFSRWQYAQYFKDNLIQLAQTDCCNCGGISETKKIADMAYAFDVAVQVHVAGSPLATNVSLQLECTMPNFTIHEHHGCNRMYSSRGLTKYNLQPVNGYFEVPDLPGIGNEWLQSAIDNALSYKVTEYDPNHPNPNAEIGKSWL